MPIGLAAAKALVVRQMSADQVEAWGRLVDAIDHEDAPAESAER